jgi:hypothetical protein
MLREPSDSGFDFIFKKKFKQIGGSLGVGLSLVLCVDIKHFFMQNRPTLH